MKPLIEITVVAAILRRGDRLLLTQRPAGVHLPMLWEFPGGKVEPGESLEMALRRELDEELGIAVEAGPLYMDTVHQYSERSVHLYFFECGIIGGEPEARSAMALGWFTPEDLSNLDLPEANRKLVERLQGERQRPIQGETTDTDDATGTQATS